MIDEFLKGISFGFGFTLGMLICFLLIAIKLGKRLIRGGKKNIPSVVIPPNELLEPFEEYMTRLEEEQRFEEMKPVMEIINELKKGNLSKNLSRYDLSVESEIMIGEKNGSPSGFKLVKRYTVIDKHR